MFWFYRPMTFVFLPNQCGVFAGLSHTPRSDKSEISFTKSDQSSYSKYVQSMNEFLEMYNDTKQDGDSYEDCGGKYHTTQSAFTICHSQLDWRSKLLFSYLWHFQIFLARTKIEVWKKRRKSASFLGLGWKTAQAQTLIMASWRGAHVLSSSSTELSTSAQR